MANRTSARRGDSQVMRLMGTCFSPRRRGDPHEGFEHSSGEMLLPVFAGVFPAARSPWLRWSSVRCARGGSGCVLGLCACLVVVRVCEGWFRAPY